MAKAVYRKYETEAETYYREKRSTNRLYRDTFSVGSSVYSSYAFDRNSGTFTVSGKTSAGFSEYDHDDFYLPQNYSKPSYEVYECSPEIGTHNGYGSYYYYVISAEKVTDYSRGRYLADVILDYGSIPANGRHTDGYWYELVRMTGISGQVDGTFLDTEGFACADGIWRKQSEIRANAGGIWKS